MSTETRPSRAAAWFATLVVFAWGSNAKGRPTIPTVRRQADVLNVK